MAVAWFQRAAERGNVDGQRELATCYELGRGTAKNLDQAKRWYALAAEQGDDRAKEAVRRLSAASDADIVP